MYAVRIAGFILMLNIAIAIVNATGVFYYTAPYTVKVTNPSEIRASWKPSVISNIPIIGDIFSGFTFLYTILDNIVNGLPSLLTVLGVPDVIVWAMKILTYFVYALALIEMISGRGGWD